MTFITSIRITKEISWKFGGERNVTIMEEVIENSDGRVFKTIMSIMC